MHFNAYLDELHGEESDAVSSCSTVPSESDGEASGKDKPFIVS